MKASVYIFGSIALVAALVLGSASSTPVNTVDTSGFLDAFYSWLWKEEGGLAYGRLAGDANLDRAPVGANAQGVFPHTSRGITKTTYETYCHSKGIPVDWNKWLEFSTLSEPNQHWKDVTTWRGRLSNNFVTDPVLKRYLSLWYFGGWVQEIVSPAQVREILNSGDTLLMQLRRLVNLRKFYFSELGRLGRAEPSTVAAWQNRAERAYELFKQFLPYV